MTSPTPEVQAQYWFNSKLSDLTNLEAVKRWQLYVENEIKRTTEQLSSYTADPQATAARQNEIKMYDAANVLLQQKANELTAKEAQNGNIERTTEMALGAAIANFNQQYQFVANTRYNDAWSRQLQIDAEKMLAQAKSQGDEYSTAYWSQTLMSLGDKDASIQERMTNTDITTQIQVAVDEAERKKDEEIRRLAQELEDSKGVDFPGIAGMFDIFWNGTSGKSALENMDDFLGLNGNPKPPGESSGGGIGDGINTTTLLMIGGGVGLLVLVLLIKK